ncbi:pentapeptide repeat-containing protein [Streptomyces sp. CA-142005]|uniref:pentapeptide repeat-containing protein n=1 Tax=Streptomyces sp. CA-142005 TaxID=3240052 RepID=UPI003D8BDE27
MLAFILVLLGPVSWLVAGGTVRSLSGKEQADALNAVRQNVLAAAGGAAVLLGLGYTARTYHLSRRGQVTGRFSTAIGQLASDKLEERVGAVFGLEHVMAESSQEHATVVSVLSAFVRERARRDAVLAPEGSGRQHQSAPPFGTEPPADIRAAMEVLARRPEREEARRIDLRRTHLVGLIMRSIDFDSPPRLACAYLTWADLRLADLRGADLRGAVLNSADLSRSLLSGALLDGAGLARADLHGAHLGGGTSLLGADLSGTDLTDARGVTAEQLSGSMLDGETRLPPDLAADPWVRARIADCTAWTDQHGPAASPPPPTARPS